MTPEDPEWIDEKMFGEIFDDVLIAFNCPLCKELTSNYEVCDSCKQPIPEPF